MLGEKPLLYIEAASKFRSDGTKEQQDIFESVKRKKSNKRNAGINKATTRREEAAEIRVKLQEFATSPLVPSYMPIASKLLYFQRRPSPAQPEPEPRDAPGRRRSSLSHRKPGQELLPGNKRDTAKCASSAGNITEHVGGMGSSSRLNRSVSDHGRLPDAVQQAKERLLQRLNSVDLSGRRQKMSSSETIWAGATHPADLGVSTSADSILGSLTSCLQSSVSIAACKVQESLAEPFGDADKCMPIALCSEPIPKLQESAGEGPLVECSICLERCGDADELIQLRCKHIFHSVCLEQWLRSRSDCPYCRASVLLTTDE